MTEQCGSGIRVVLAWLPLCHQAALYWAMVGVAPVDVTNDAVGVMRLGVAAMPSEGADWLRRKPGGGAGNRLGRKAAPDRQRKLG